MKKLIEFIKSISWVQWLAVALIVIGLLIMVPKIQGMIEFTKEVQYAAQNHFDQGNLPLDLIRPWMSLRYVAAAYGVPQQYMYDALKITPRRETSMIAINRLNKQMGLGKVDGQPELIKTVREAIQTYHANPVAPGLLEKQVDNWMTIYYISNSTGIPSQTLFDALGLPQEGNLYLPLGFLSTQTNYKGGEKALMATLQTIVDQQGIKP